MKPIKFKGTNATYAKDQPEYLSLPSFKVPGSPEGDVICCWKLSRRERAKLLFTGRLWLSLWTFNKPLTPHRPSVHKREFIKK